MSSALSINGKNLVPIKEVVGSSEYTRDYIAKLARDGQIVGAQVGRQWYIDATSLENFKSASALESEVRRRHLSLTRRRERDLKHEVTKHFDIVAVRSHKARVHAVAQSVLVLMVGLSTGYFMFALSHLEPGLVLVQKAQTFILSGQLFQNSLLSDVTSHQIPTVVSSTSILEQVTFSPVDEVVAFGESEGVLVFSGDVSTSSSFAVERLFSDPVQVIADSKTSGTLVLGAAAATRTLPFVLVPVVATGSDVAMVKQVGGLVTP